MRHRSICYTMNGSSVYYITGTVHNMEESNNAKMYCLQSY